MERKQKKIDQNETINIYEEIESCLYFPNKLAFIFGLQKIRILTTEKIIQNMPSSYKIFSLSLLITLSTLMTFSVIRLLKDSTISESTFFKISIPSSYTFLAIFHFVTIVHNQFFAPKIYKEMLNCLIELNKTFLILKCPTPLSFKKSLILLIAIQFLSKLFNLVATILGPMEWTKWVYLFSSIVVDTEVLLMVCNMELAARSFEILNKKLCSFEFIDFDLKQCIVDKMWSISYEEVDVFFVEDDIDACLSILNYLTQYLDSANTCYRPTV